MIARQTISIVIVLFLASVFMLNGAGCQRQAPAPSQLTVEPSGNNVIKPPDPSTAKLPPASVATVGDPIPKPEVLVKSDQFPGFAPEKSPVKLREQTTLKGHASQVRSLAISPDGKTLASGGYGEMAANGNFKGVIKLWDLASGTEKATLEGHGNSVLGLAFTPNGKALISGSHDKTVKVWDLTLGKAVLSLPAENEIWPVAVSPDGRIVAAGSEGKIILWDLATGQHIRTLSGHSDKVLTLAFSPDGTLLASGGMDNTAKLWNAASGKELALLDKHPGWVVSVAFTPDGKTLASGAWDDTLRLWDVVTFKQRARLSPGTRQGSHIGFSGDGRFMVVGGPKLGLAGTVAVFDMTTGKETERADWQLGLMWALALTPDGRIAATGHGDEIKLWHVQPDK